MTGTAARHIIIVGQGAAGLAAALSAAEAARAVAAPIDITVIDKASPDEAGGNTRWSPSNMRMAAPDGVEPGFVADMMKATGSKGDEAYFTRLAAEAPAAGRWLSSLGIEFIQPPYYLAKGPPRIQPVGGGARLIDVLTRAAESAGVRFRHNCEAVEIVREGNRVSGLVVESGGARHTLPADAIVLACGGFQGNATMMRAE
ncbi:MAG TPA: FAD-dependent oxidoreductase, partial [Pseudolabrys sp.]|nr:FAD-dependent oxidoreductase [Pseudolabrys sp.]